MRKISIDLYLGEVLFITRSSMFDDSKKSFREARVADLSGPPILFVSSVPIGVTDLITIFRILLDFSFSFSKCQNVENFPSFFLLPGKQKIRNSRSRAKDDYSLTITMDFNCSNESNLRSQKKKNGFEEASHYARCSLSLSLSFSFIDQSDSPLACSLLYSLS